MYDNKKQEVKTGLAPLGYYQKLKIFDFRPILPVPHAKSAMIFMIENLSEPWSKLKFVQLKEIDSVYRYSCNIRPHFILTPIALVVSGRIKDSTIPSANIDVSMRV